MERPINGRLYRTTWLFVALPVILLAFAINAPTALPRPQFPPTFNVAAAVQDANDFAGSYPVRTPGTGGATRAADWLTGQLAALGYRSQTARFRATIPGTGTVELRNITAVAVAPTSSPETIVVVAHRDNTGISAGADDNASGTAALIELARAYARPPGTTGGSITPAHTIVFLSTDGGAFGAIGAAHFVAHSAYRSRVVAVIDLDALAGPGPPRIELAGDTPRSPADVLVATAAARIREITNSGPDVPSAFAQLVDLAFPFSLYEQAPFVGAGIPAVTLTTNGSRPPAGPGDQSFEHDAVAVAHLTVLGQAAQALLTSIDQAPEGAQGTSSYIFLGQRFVPGWALELALLSLLIPYFAAAIDLFARGRRRGLALAPALRSLRTRLLFWLWAGALFELFALLGAWPGGAARPLNPDTAAASGAPTVAVLAYLLLLGLSWLVGRDRLRRRRPVQPEELLAGYTAGLLGLGLVALLLAALNPFALIFVLPSLHAWLWLPQVRGGRAYLRAAFLLVGFAGPLVLLGSFAFRFHLGLDAPWYLAELAAIGYVPFMALLVVLAWAATAAQLTAIATGLYAPYPRQSERGPRGPIRNSVRAVVLASRTARRGQADRRALGG